MTETSHRGIDVALSSFRGGPYLAETFGSIAMRDHPATRALPSGNGFSQDTLVIAHRHVVTMALAIVGGPPSGWLQ
ncbi:hypothetical protein [Devosia sp.]|uniref:hypothetical protein n=1 Tax=Devosia sp. TaxID=1871048 RepID=UPI002FC8E318